MPARLDHLILAVNDIKQSIDFYTRILALEYEGERPPFSVMRVAPDFVIQLAPWGTKGNEHLAFSMSLAEFEQAFARIKEAGLEFGDSFHAANNMCTPGPADGARGNCKSLYLFDPNHHLIELAYYE